MRNNASSGSKYKEPFLSKPKLLQSWPDLLVTRARFWDGSHSALANSEIRSTLSTFNKSLRFLSPFSI